MKRFLSAVMACVMCSALALAAPAQTSLTPVKATHQRTQRHRAHKAPKHRAPKRSHRTT